MKFKNFRFLSGVRQECPILLVLFNIVLGGSVQCYKMREGKVMFETEEANLVFKDYMIVYVENQKEARHKLSELKSIFSKVAGENINLQIYLYILDKSQYKI